MSYSIAGLISPGSNNPQSTGPVGPVVADEAKSFFKDAAYTPIWSNWYSAKPYGFRLTPRGNTRPQMTMFLPIGPSNLSIVTNFATSLTPTIYGTVEEHSPVRYYDITIEGTTGMGPKYVTPTVSSGDAPAQLLGRSSFTVKQGIELGGFFSKTLNTAQSAVSATKSLLGTNPPSVNTGIQLDKTGYAAFHNLYRFLLEYKRDASGDDISTRYVERGEEDDGDDSHPLTFFNYKDNNEYKVVVRSFVLRRDKEDPMLYFYSITMRGYDLRPADAPKNVNNIDSAAKILENLGLIGVNAPRGASILTQMKDISSQGKSVLGSVGGGLNQLGR